MADSSRTIVKAARGSSSGSQALGQVGVSPVGSSVPARSFLDSPGYPVGSLILAPQKMSAAGFGKAILLGEHAVVYGQPAIAVALPDLALRLTLLPRGDGAEPQSWDDAWHVSPADPRRPLAPEARSMLTRCLAMALGDAGLALDLESFAPQPLRIESNFPMGAGLGGSAALCVAAVRLADALVGLQRTSPSAFAASEGDSSAGSHDIAQQDGLLRAARLDHIFHGTASGIDTATSFSGGLVKAQSAGPGMPRHFEPLANARSFYIALVDTGERSQTAAMVESLAQRKRQQPVFVGEKIGRLGELAAAATTDLREGRLAELGSHLNEAHEHLSDLGMSTPDLDRVVLNLRELGALGAKLTGSGGGGFALGLFRDYPQWVESYLPAKGAVYVSEVPAVSVQECQRRASGFAPAGSTDIKPERGN